VVVTSLQVVGVPGLTWLNPVVGPLGTAALVVTMVIFMLIERRELRGRLVGLFGKGQLRTTATALDEAGALVSRQLLMQMVVSVAYGIAAGVGLYFLGVPYPFVWATLAAAFRFVPYVGPALGAGAPILVSLAATDGWAGPLAVIAGFIVLELLTNLVLEPVLYAGATGLSPVALLTAVAFWTWLWGPIGLVIATPLTVCVVVIGKHVAGLEFVGALLADTASRVRLPAETAGHSAPDHERGSAGWMRQGVEWITCRTHSGWSAGHDGNQEAAISPCRVPAALQVSR
jgi:predicted PurR-regulated permease PerM